MRLGLVLKLPSEGITSQGCCPQVTITDLSPTPAHVKGWYIVFVLFK